MTNAVVGAARVVFGADTDEFDSKAKGVEGVLARLVDRFRAVEAEINKIGIGLSAGITLPFAAMVRAVDKGAGSFEAQMKRVEAALDNVSGTQLKALAAQARELGPAVGKGATDAAAGIEALGLAGVSTSDIMGGALKATLDLASAGMVDTSVSASLVTDVFGQFKKSTADLPDVVRNVVGALDASKFGFEDFQLAVAQGGGVAASAGIDFRDFATAVAATSTQFSSGSDAGTSFKTYIQSLVGNSDDAKYAMKKLGIEFFDAQGRMKPLALQAQILRDKLGGLSDASKTEALKTIFGSDAARTAIGLMEQGAAGFDKLQKTIEGGDVNAKIAKRMEGDAAAGQRIANAWESVKIAIGETGLLDIIFSIKNGFARLLEAIAHAPPALLKVGAVFAALTAALGPLLLALNAVGVFLAVRFLKGFGLIGRAISLIFAPMETLISIFMQFGALTALRVVGTMLMRLLGPVGIAISAFMLFKDSIVAALGQVWEKAQATLGTPIAALMSALQGVFSTVQNGPIGTALGYLVTAFNLVKDVVGTAIAFIIERLGDALITGIGVAVAALTGIVGVVQGVVDTVGALLTGDFAGAWDAAGRTVDAVAVGIAGIIDAVFPGIGETIKAAYDAARTWLVDGFQSIYAFFASITTSAVDTVAAAFPNVVAAAKSVYEGVKGWLVDKFGTLISWIGTAAKWIGDKYAALKERLGLGGAPAANDNPAPPPAPKPVADQPGPKRTVDLEKPKKERGSGRSTKYDGQNREELRLQAELEAARARNDKEAEQSIQDRLDREKQVEAYQRTGLTLDQARVAAARDLNLIKAARAAQAAKEIADEQAAVALDVAQITGNAQLEESLGRQAELRRRIAFYYEQTKNLAEATRLAEADQLKMDEARAEVRRRWMADDAADRELRLAQERGDSDASIRRLQTAIDIRKRARELEAQQVAPADALAQATAEAAESERARLQGVFRSSIKGGFQAAMDGDLKGWFKDWWKERTRKGMEEALNSLSDLIASLFSQVKTNMAGGQGLFSSIGSALGSLVGATRGITGVSSAISGANNVPVSINSAGAMSAILSSASVPKFATGGSFKVGGMSGIDQNLVSMRLSKGEMVDIRKPGNDTAEGGTWVIEASPYFDVRAARASEPQVAQMGTRAAAGGSAMAQQDIAKRGRRRLA